MKLSSIIAYRNQLESMSLDAIRGQAEHELSAINHVVANNESDIGFYKHRIEKRFSAVKDSFDQFDKVFSGLKSDLDLQIKKQEVAYYKESTRFYQDEMCWESNEYLLNRKLAIDDESNLILRNRLRSYTDWRVPGMIIRPSRETFIQELVPLDPLYIVDQHQDLIDPALSEFNDTYRARLRPYVINETDEHILAALPNDQFGLIFAYNYFNFRPIEVITRYLVEMYKKMRPGGMVIMTINDCDRAHSVELVEQKFMCYTPGRAICQAAESAGFDIVYQHTGLGDLSWLELQRPGQISSLRGGQTLAKIVARSK